MPLDDAALVDWIGDDYPHVIEAIARRLPVDTLQSINVEQGWWPLLTRIDAQLSAVDPAYRLAHLDAVDGRLQLEVEVWDATVYEQVHRIIGDAIAEAAHTCEFCGRRDARNLRTSPGRWETLCDDDAGQSASPPRPDTARN